MKHPMSFETTHTVYQRDHDDLPSLGMTLGSSHARTGNRQSCVFAFALLPLVCMPFRVRRDMSFAPALRVRNAQSFMETATRMTHGVCRGRYHYHTVYRLQGMKSDRKRPRVSTE